MKNIICGIDDQYCQHCGAMLLSLFESNPGAITIYVLSLELSEKSKNLLKELVDSYQKQIHFIDIPSELVLNFPMKSTDYPSLATYLRLFIPQLLPFEVDKALYGKHANNVMKTDVKETDTGYEVDIDLPGFKKDEINAQLDNGYLTISAAKGLDKDEKDKKGKYIRKERYAGAMSRSFYVGEGITQEDIKAKYEDGILRLSVPKKEAKAVENKKYIAIEG